MIQQKELDFDWLFVFRLVFALKLNKLKLKLYCLSNKNETVVFAGLGNTEKTDTKI